MGRRRDTFVETGSPAHQKLRKNRVIAASRSKRRSRGGANCAAPPAPAFSRAASRTSNSLPIGPATERPLVGRQAPNASSAPRDFDGGQPRPNAHRATEKPPGHFKLMVSPLSANENLNPTCRPRSRKATPLELERLTASAPPATATPAPMALYTPSISCTSLM